MNRIASRLLAGPSIRPRRVAAVSGVSTQWVQSRNVHNALELPYDVEGGLGEFLPPAALKTVAVEYQQGLLDRLNNEVANTPQKNKSVVQTVIDAAKDPSKALMFNYASEALNNSFFVNSLRPPKDGQPSHEEDISIFMKQAIRAAFESTEQMKSAFSAAAMGMMGTGWVWLVTDQRARLAIYPTFGTGTLLVRSQRFLPQLAGVPPTTLAEDPHKIANLRVTPSSPVSGSTRAKPDPPHQPHIQTRSLSTPSGMYPSSSASSKDVSTMGDKIFPLLCLSVHEHCWMSAGYGVWGKEEWLKKYWSVVNWKQASEHLVAYYTAVPR